MPRRRGARRGASDGGEAAWTSPLTAPPSSLRELAEEALLAGVGAAALTKERADELADELAGKGQAAQRDEARELVDDVMGALARRRRPHERARRARRSRALFREVGLVTRREYEELELRLAQLEHRLRLLEKQDAVSSRPRRPPARAHVRDRAGRRQARFRLRLRRAARSCRSRRGAEVERGGGLVARPALARDARRARARPSSSSASCSRRARTSSRRTSSSS